MRAKKGDAMKNIETIDGNHPAGWVILEYSENALPNEFIADIEDHLGGCPECSKDLERINNLSSALLESKEFLFCPELWRLYDIAVTGEYPDNEMFLHVSNCPSCSENIQLLRQTHTSDTDIPLNVKRAFADQYSVQSSHKGADALKTAWEHARETIRSMFSAPLAGALVAASLIIAVMVSLPTTQPGDEFALSSLQWTPLKTGAAPKEYTHRPPGAQFGIVHKEIDKPQIVKPKSRLAVVIFLDGFETPFSQKTIDELYVSIGSEEIRKSATMVDPSKIKQLVTEKEIGPNEDDKLLGGLAKDLKADKAIFIHISRKDGLYEVAQRLIDAGDKKTLNEMTLQSHDVEDLALKLEKSIPRLLNFRG